MSVFALSLSNIFLGDSGSLTSDAAYIAYASFIVYTSLISLWSLISPTLTGGCSWRSPLRRRAHTLRDATYSPPRASPAVVHFNCTKWQAELFASELLSSRVGGCDCKAHTAKSKVKQNQRAFRFGHSLLRLPKRIERLINWLRFPVCARFVFLFDQGERRFSFGGAFSKPLELLCVCGARLSDESFSLFELLPDYSSTHQLKLWAHFAAFFVNYFRKHVNLQDTI